MRNKFRTMSISSKGLVLIVELIIEVLLKHYFLTFCANDCSNIYKEYAKIT